jgi:hypothetical protein
MTKLIAKRPAIIFSLVLLALITAGGASYILVSGSKSSPVVLATYKDKPAMSDGLIDQAVWDDVGAATVTTENGAIVKLKAIYTKDKFYMRALFSDSWPDSTDTMLLLFNVDNSIIGFNERGFSAFERRSALEQKKAGATEWWPYFMKGGRSIKGWQTQQGNVWRAVPGREYRRVAWNIGLTGKTSDEIGLLQNYPYDAELQRAVDDVSARMDWAEYGTWTVEFSRQLNTGHPREVVFAPKQAAAVDYRFGLGIRAEGEKLNTAAPLILEFAPIGTGQ